MSVKTEFIRAEAKAGKIPLILKLDQGGIPIRWITWQTATTLYFNDKMAWTPTTETVRLYGGIGRDGEQSFLDLPTIMAVHDLTALKRRKAPLLTNRELFRRDANICMYCGSEYPNHKLTRDHVVPISVWPQGNIWTNCVTACKSCNHRKANRTPEQAGMKLLAVPYTPSQAEFLLLQNRRVLSDQMEFLRTMIPAESPYFRRH